MRKYKNEVLNRYDKLLLIETIGVSIVLIISLSILIWILLEGYNLGNTMSNILNTLANLGSIAGGCAAIYVFYSIPKWKKDYDNKFIREKSYIALANIDALESLILRQVKARKSYVTHKERYDCNHQKADLRLDEIEKWRNEIRYLYSLTRDKLLILKELSYYFEYINNHNEIKDKLDRLEKCIEVIHTMGYDSNDGVSVNTFLISNKYRESIKDTKIFELTKSGIKELIQSN